MTHHSLEHQLSLHSEYLDVSSSLLKNIKKVESSDWNEKGFEVSWMDEKSRKSIKRRLKSSKRALNGVND